MVTTRVSDGALDSTGSRRRARSTGTRPRRCSTRTRWSAATAGSPRVARSPSTPACTRAARRTTSSSSASPARRTGSGGVRSTPRSRRSSSRACATKVVAHLGGARPLRRRRVRGRRPGAPDRASASSPTTPTTPSSRGRCSSTRPRPSCATSSRGARPPRAGVEADPEEDGTRSGTFVVLHPTRAEVLIGGTFYAGEIKKSIFTVMNDRLPLEGVFPMHCSANVGDDGDVAVFFGLSGTGKTTLSADPDAPPDRRRRARLGRRRRLQLRGRLLREGDPPLGGGRAGDLQDDAHVRHDPRERRPRRARRRRPRRRLEDREHARRLQARADRERPARRSAPGTRARS